jgi:hypothetical protein
MVEALARHDPDALSDSIELLESLHTTGSGSKSAHTSLDIGIILFRVLEVSPSAEVKSRAARCISGICESSHTLAIRLFTDLRRDTVEAPPLYPLRLNSTPGRPNSPSLMNAELRLWGSILSVQCTQQSTWSESLVRTLGAWSAVLQRAGDERNVRYGIAPLWYLHIECDRNSPHAWRQSCL